MKLYKANYLHLFQAALALAQSDRDEMERVEAGRDPVEVLTASSNDPTVMHISDDSGKVLAVGGHQHGLIWFVHTVHAEALSAARKAQMLKLLRGHLQAIKEGNTLLIPFTNVVSSENKAHIKLLRHLGAVWNPEPFMHNGHEFRQFYF
ncbi:phage protein Gp13 family protein [Pseudomonas sp. USHLN015]|uniref:phage protein Gp13 family protein n=1 Tax=Pseudomonas sp. USHLN015 TaxID=3081296 RepID=UPI00301D13BC